MLHNTLIVLHTIAALVCLVSGCFVVYKPPQTREQARLFQLYLATLVLLVAFMLVAIIGDWAHLAPFSQAAFVVLGLLGLYMVARGFQARRTLREQTEGWKQQFIDHVGFTLISLFDGFIIVSALDLNVPSWIVIVIAIIAIFVGISIVNASKRRVTEWHSAIG